MTLGLLQTETLNGSLATVAAFALVSLFRGSHLLNSYLLRTRTDHTFCLQAMGA